MKRPTLATLIAAPALLLAALLAPGIAAAAGPITSDACSSSAGTATCEIWAKAGTTDMPGQAGIPVYGFTAGTTGAGDPVTAPGGPVLIVNEGDTVSVTLHNDLAASTALSFEGVDDIPDLAPVAAGASKAYTFVASAPGTYLYEAASVSDAGGQAYQLAMGLYGVLVVRPTAAGQAYDAVSTAFTDEGVVLVSELDPALNTSATPSAFDLRGYAPRYFLINGKAYPDTDAVDVTAGGTMLIRYANAGLRHHSMATLGVDQTLIGDDASPLTFPRRFVAETLGPGQTMDALVSIGAGVADGTKYALYDANDWFANSSGGAFGGMLTFLNVTSGGPGGGGTGPVTDNAALSPNPTNGSSSVTVTATVSSGTATVTAAEYFIDSTGAAGTGTAMSGSFGSGSVSVTGSITAATLAGLPSGNHTVYVHGQDSNGDWGSFDFATLNLDKTGPAITGATLTPSHANGTVNVAVSATANDSAAGGSNVTSAEYWIDAGAHQPLSLNVSAPISALTGTIPAATVNALSEGAHAISIQATDALGNLGPISTVDLVVDKTGPITSGVSANPTPNNGARPYDSSTPAVRVTATLDDVLSDLAAGEAFIDSVGANGSGAVMIATDGTFNASHETAYVDIPLTTIAQLSNGTHTIYVHGRDAAGNWGATATGTIVIDKVAPLVTSITRDQTSPIAAASVSWTVTFTEAVTGVSASNFTLVQGSGLTGASITSVTGTGATRTVTASTGSGGGTLGLDLTSAAGITDVATNTLSTSNLPFVGQSYTLLTPPLYFSLANNTLPTGVGGSGDDADIYFWDGAAFSRTIDASAAPYGLPASGSGNANVDGFDRVDATHFYMSFTGQVNVPGIGNVQDEDVVYYDAGTWSLFFDGSAQGLASSSFDLDAISIVGGTLYFSTDNNNVPPGAGGTGDDADIYRWNGGSSYTRVADASALGWSTANVDGLVWVDPTHLYLSYSGNAGVPGLGTVPDEDVVYLSGGSWSSYFDGTARGLPGNVNVDAFDIP